LNPWEKKKRKRTNNLDTKLPIVNNNRPKKRRKVFEKIIILPSEEVVEPIPTTSPDSESNNSDTDTENTLEVESNVDNENKPNVENISLEIIENNLQNNEKINLQPMEEDGQFSSLQEGVTTVTDEINDTEKNNHLVKKNDPQSEVIVIPKEEFEVQLQKMQYFSQLLSAVDSQKDSLKPTLAQIQNELREIISNYQNYGNQIL